MIWLSKNHRGGYPAAPDEVMATTSIWRVKGWLGKVVVYVENPDKTTNPKFYTDKDMTEQDGQELSDVIRYAVNSRKRSKWITRSAP